MKKVMLIASMVLMFSVSRADTGNPDTTRAIAFAACGSNAIATGAYLLYDMFWGQFNSW